MDENAGKAADLGGIKSRLQLRYPGFDEKEYGYRSIRELIDKETKFSVYQEGTHAVVISDKKDNAEDNELEAVCRFMIDMYPNKVIGQHEISALGRKLKNMYPNFQYKQYGYKKLSTFLEDTHVKKRLQIWFIGRTLASQAGKAGSTPVICWI